MESKNRYLSPKQIYEIYGIEPSKTYYWIREGRIIYTKPGKKTVLIPEADFLRFLEIHTINKTTDIGGN